MSFLLVRFNYLQDFAEVDFFELQHFDCFEDVASFDASALLFFALVLLLLDAFFLPNIVTSLIQGYYLVIILWQIVEKIYIVKKTKVFDF